MINLENVFQFILDDYSDCRIVNGNLSSKFILGKPKNNPNRLRTISNKDKFLDQNSLEDYISEHQLFLIHLIDFKNISLTIQTDRTRMYETEASFIFEEVHPIKPFEIRLNNLSVQEYQLEYLNIK